MATTPKLSIKLDDKKYLCKLHRLLVNPEIPPQFESSDDREHNRIYAAYDRSLVQDQALFTWLLSTFSDMVLPRVLNSHHAWQVWDTIHKHFYAHLKAKMCQLRAELKSTKKGNGNIIEFITRICAIANSLFTIGDHISDSDLVDRKYLTAYPKSTTLF